MGTKGNLRGTPVCTFFEDKRRGLEDLSVKIIDVTDVRDSYCKGRFLDSKIKMLYSSWIKCNGGLKFM